MPTEEQTGDFHRRIGLLILLALMLLAFCLRLAAAQGGLWLDEAWSALLAREVTGPAGIFLGINHDNVHHLNSLWLQSVGWDASPPLARGLSILCGTLAVPVAWAIGAEWGRKGAAVAAFAFASSPILVTYGAEARGYAPMILFLLIAILLVQRSQRAEKLPNGFGLAVTALLGMLSHLTMIFGLIALAGGVAVHELSHHGFAAGLRRSVRAVAPALIVAMLVILLVLRAGAATPSGFQLGGYESFDAGSAVTALAQAIAYTLGSFWSSPILVLLGAFLVLWVLWRLRPALAGFHLLAIIAFPAAVLAIGLGNSGYVRYYLVAAVALLLLAGFTVSSLLRAEGQRKYAGALLLAGFAAGSLALNLRIIRDRHADPGEAIALMRARAAGGSDILLAGEQGSPVQIRPRQGGPMKAIDVGRHAPVLMAAADQAGYRLKIERDPCVGARFLFLAEPPEVAPVQIVQCGRLYRRLKARPLATLSGAPWALYEQARDAS